MNAEIHELILALREELTLFGELLSLLEEQQRLILGHATEGLLENLQTIHAQAPVIALARGKRENCRRRLAESLGQPAATTFRQLLAWVPSECRGLLKALADEINDLLVRSQQRLRQNHLLLRRSLNSLRQVALDLFAPQSHFEGEAVRVSRSPQPRPSRRLPDDGGTSQTWRMELSDTAQPPPNPVERDGEELWNLCRQESRRSTSISSHPRIRAPRNDFRRD